MVKQNKIHFRRRVQHKCMTQQLFSAVLRMDTEGYTAAKISEATGLTEHNVNEYLAASKFRGTVSYPAVKDEVRRQHTAKAINDVSATSANSANSATGGVDKVDAVIGCIAALKASLETYHLTIGTLTIVPVAQ